LYELLFCNTFRAFGDAALDYQILACLHVGSQDLLGPQLRLFVGTAKGGHPCSSTPTLQVRHVWGVHETTKNTEVLLCIANREILHVVAHHDGHEWFARE